jgi:hypothetical protein
MSESRKVHSPRKGEMDSEQGGLKSVPVTQEHQCLGGLGRAFGRCLGVVFGD